MHSCNELTNREWTDPAIRESWESARAQKLAEHNPLLEKILADNPKLAKVLDDKPVIQGNGPHGTNEEYDFEESDFAAGLDDLSDEASVSQDGPQQ